MAYAFDAGDAVLDGLGDLRFKLGRRGAELRQRVADLGVETLGAYGLAVFADQEGHDRTPNPAPRPPAPDEAEGWLSRAMFRRATTIYGGANEIQRNIIAKSVLEL